jgi:hypothetical protein
MTDINQAKQILLAEWERERDELNIMISRLRRELGPAVGGQSSQVEELVPDVLPGAREISVEQLVNPGDFFGMTQVNAAKEFLQRRKRQTANLKEIAAALHRGKAIDIPYDADSMKNLSSIISRSEDFVSVARGRWGLAEWYPERVLKKHRKAKDTADERPSEDAPNPETKEESK